MKKQYSLLLVLFFYLFTSFWGNLKANNNAANIKFDIKSSSVNDCLPQKVPQYSTADKAVLRKEFRKIATPFRFPSADEKDFPQKGDMVKIQLFDNLTCELTIERSEIVWVNEKKALIASAKTATSDNLLNAVIINADGNIRIEIDDFASNKSYSFAFDPHRNLYLATENDKSKFSQKCSTCSDGLCTQTVARSVPKHKPDTHISTKYRLSPTEITEIDLMIVFDNSGKNQLNGNIEPFALAVTEMMNNVFANSNIAARYVLKSTMSIDYTANSLPQASNQAIIDPEVRNRRETLKIDMLLVLSETSSDMNVSGLAAQEAQSPDWAYASVRVTSAIGIYSAAHELGHVFGCNHSRNQFGAVGVHEYAVGTENGPYNTVMSYGIEDTHRVPIFSGTESVWKGVQLGSPTEDNVRKIRERLAVVADFGNQIKDKFNLDITEWTPNNTAQSTTVSLKTRSFYFIKTNTDWLKTTPAMGVENADITISVDENKNSAAREGIVTITQVGESGQREDYFLDDVHIKVVQAGAGTNIKSVETDATVRVENHSILIYTTDTLQIKVFSLLGNLVYSTSSMQGITNINHLKTGSYIVLIENVAYSKKAAYKVVI